MFLFFERISVYAFNININNIVLILLLKYILFSSLHEYAYTIIIKFKRINRLFNLMWPYFTVFDSSKFIIDVT